ncbi:MAG: hypothetical protein IJ242_16460 [Clostridia bacterium]|nr:hypothetical protein [Clostridia bacterium]
MEKQKYGTALILLCVALFLITFCSQSSPLYPLNTWDDANCLLTVGRAMHSGATLYKDIYEQKGPTLYALHALAAAVSDTSFFGVYLLEILACWLTLCAAYRIARSGHTPALVIVAFFGALTYASGAFCRGDSAEEFCLPCLTGLLAIADHAEKEGFSPKQMMIMGFLSGIIGTIKFTILGVPLGLCIFIAIRILPQSPVRLLKAAACFLLGMLIPIAAWLLYFAAKGALSDYLTAYLYNNIFLYAGDYSGLDIPWLIRTNWPWFLMLLPALYTLIHERKWGVLLPLMVQTAVLVAGGRMWLYTPLVLTPFILYGMKKIWPVVDKRIRPGVLRILPGLAALVLAALLTPNAYMRFVPLEQTAQGRLAACIPENSTFLQYSHLDDGMYLMTHSLPQEKYFCSLNVGLPEMHEELDRYLTEGIPEYVLITWRMLPEAFSRYRQIDYATGYDNYNHLKKDFFLYERIDP